VDNCNECGQCVEKCPYDLEIPVLIRQVKKMYSEIG
jgi:predicted aldo/keto reductase-like oxidoreductase